MLYAHSETLIWLFEVFNSTSDEGKIIKYTIIDNNPLNIVAF